MSKKGVELTMNTIIIAALALLVLVVLVIVFTGSFGDVINKFLGIKMKAIGKADCIVVGQDTAGDADHDGYYDSKKYDYQCKVGGKMQTKQCRCDSEPTNPAVNEDTTCTQDCDENKK
jgi:hypothetical protein